MRVSIEYGFTVLIYMTLLRFRNVIDMNVRSHVVVVSHVLHCTHEPRGPGCMY